MTPEQALQQSQSLTLLGMDYYKIYLSGIEGTSDIYFENSPTYADFDYYVYINQRLNHLVEVKVRFNAFDKYPNTKLPLRKHASAEHLVNAYGLKTYFLAVFNDGVVARLDLTKEPDFIEEMVARYDRGNDTDIYAMYSIRRFEQLANIGVNNA